MHYEFVHAFNSYPTVTCDVYNSCHSITVIVSVLQLEHTFSFILIINCTKTLHYIHQQTAGQRLLLSCCLIAMLASYVIRQMQALLTLARVN